MLGGGPGAAQAALSKSASTELDLYNARSVKLAEATRVRLFLPGLKGGPVDEWDEPSDAKASAQAAAARAPSETAMKIRKKLAKVAALAHASEAAAGGAGGGDGGGGSGAGGGGDDAAGGGMMMLVEAIVDLEDEDDDPADYLLPAGGAAGEGRGARPVSAKGPSQGADGERTSPNGGDGSRLSGASGTGAGPGAQGRGGGGGRARPGSAVAGNRPSSASTRRHGDGADGSPSRARSGAGVSGDAAGGGQRVPVWARLAASSNTSSPPTREKLVPTAPKVYKAVQGKTLSLGLGGPDDGSGLFMVADPAAPYYGVEPGNGSGAVAAAAGGGGGGRAGWPPVMPPVGGWVRANAMAAAAAMGRGSGGGVMYTPYDMESAPPAGSRRGQEPPAGTPHQQYGTSAGGAGSNGPYMRPRRLGSGTPGGRAAQASSSGMSPGGGGGGGPGSGGGAGPGPPASVPGAVLRVGVHRGSNLHRVGSEVVQPAPMVVFHKAYSSDLVGDAARATNGSGGGGGPGPPSAVASPPLTALQQRAGPPSPVAVPMAWADAPGGGGHAPSRNVAQGTSSPLRYAGGGAGGGGGGPSPSNRALPGPSNKDPSSPLAHAGQRAQASPSYMQQPYYQSQQQQQPQQQAAYGTGPASSQANGYAGAHTQPEAYNAPSRYAAGAGPSGGGARGGGGGGLYGVNRATANAALLFATGSTPQVTPAAMAAAAVAAGGSGGGAYEAGLSGAMGGSRYRSSSFTQLAPTR